MEHNNTPLINAAWLDRFGFDIACQLTDWGADEIHFRGYESGKGDRWMAARRDNLDNITDWYFFHA